MSRPQRSADVRALGQPPGAPRWAGQHAQRLAAPNHADQTAGAAAAEAPPWQPHPARTAPPVGPVHGAPPLRPGYCTQPYPATYDLGSAPSRHHLRGNAALSTGLAAYGPPAPARKQRWPLYVGVISALVVAVLIMGFVVPGLLVSRQLDVTQVQAGVEHILSDPAGYGAKNVSDVTCNDGHNPTIHQGDSFTCEATIDRVRQLFVVTFTDDAGSYQVGHPR